MNRLERSRRFKLTSTRPLTDAERAAFAALVHDRMTEEIYAQPLLRCGPVQGTGQHSTVWCGV